MAHKTYGGYVIDVPEPGRSGGVLTRPDKSREHMQPKPALLVLRLMERPNMFLKISDLSGLEDVSDATMKTHASRARAAIRDKQGNATIEIDGTQQDGWRLRGLDRNMSQVQGVKDLFEELDGQASVYRVTQATREDIVWAADLASRTYTGIDIIDEAKMLDWWHANPTGFSILFRNDVRMGNLDVLPLRKSALDKFLAGSIIELDLTGRDILRPDERTEISALYVESIVIEERMNPGNNAVRPMLRAFQDIARRVCQPSRECMVYAISATDVGEILLQGLGFDKIGTPDQRRDKHQVWSAPLPVVLRRITLLLSVSPAADFGPLLDAGL